MGPGSSTYPEQHGSDPFAPPLPPPSVERPEFWRREPRLRYVVLFIITLLTTVFAGAGFYASFAFGFQEVAATPPLWDLLIEGLWYSLPVLAILGAHEFGHYFACVHYRVNASLPYFIPFPMLFGTLGAVIRIRQPIPSKRALFDIGIAGPLAGFAVAVPVLVAGVALSKVMAIPETYAGEAWEFGEPLLFQFAGWLVFGPIPDGQSIVLHPMGFAAWFGLLATALNLFPIGQLDGGHIAYAVFGRRSTVITLTAVACLVSLAAFVSSSWVVWAALTVLMVIVLGPRHPRVWDEEVPLDRARLIWAAVALLIFIICFTPAPIEFAVFGADPAAQ
jgi:membrane-associated protease RseP (regulator of RpoE activity)